MQCAYCGRMLVQPPGRGRRRKFCDPACKMRYARGIAAPLPPTLPRLPALHCGRFEDYQAAYAGCVDVIITDLPYARKALPLYEALGQFALTTLVPGGWLLCLTGWGLDLAVRQGWQQAGLEFVTVGCYDMPGVHNRAEKRLSTGKRSWQEHHKPLLWYHKRGTAHHRRRAGGSDRIHVVAQPDMDQHARPWQQSLAGFQAIVRIFTNAGDVLCDPCMGWGTTLEAAVSLDRRRVIGIEVLPERYAYACERMDTR
jgi:hypothetical protein